MPGGYFVFGAQGTPQSGSKVLASIGQANERKLVVAVAENRMLFCKSLPEKLDFHGEQLAVAVVNGFSRPKTGDFEGNLATGLLPEQNIGGARSKPQKSLGAIKTRTEFALASVI